MKIVVRVVEASASLSINGREIASAHVENVTRVFRTPPRRIKLPAPDGVEVIIVNRKQTAKLIREDLKRAYPSVKFSVTTKMMSGGYTSIDVTWKDEAIKMDEVCTLLDQYRGAISDLDDGLDHVAVEIEGRWYHFEVDYLGCYLTSDVPEFVEGKAARKVAGLED